MAYKNHTQLVEKYARKSAAGVRFVGAAVRGIFAKINFGAAINRFLCSDTIHT
jgi:hypothetical protein